MMAKNKIRKFKPPQKQVGLNQKALKKIVADSHMQRMDDRLNQIIDSIVRMQQQTEVNRLGIVTLNRLHTERDWPILLTKARQFMFGLVAFLQDKYPNILAEVHRCLEDARFEEIENVIGAFNAPIGYTIEDFKTLFQQASFFRDTGDAMDDDMHPQIIDEEGTDEEAEKVFSEFLKNVNQKSGQDEEFIKRVAASESVEHMDESYTPIVATKQFEDPGLYEEECIAEEDISDERREIIKDHFLGGGRIPMPLEDNTYIMVEAKYCKKCGESFQRKEGLTDHNWNMKSKCDKCSKKRK
jgi:hypothetical protein